jgi:uncharacterized protein Veg
MKEVVLYETILYTRYNKFDNIKGTNLLMTTTAGRKRIKHRQGLLILASATKSLVWIQSQDKISDPLVL